MRDDANEIADRLQNDVEGVLNRYYPGWIKQGNKALLTPRIKPGQKKATSSFTVNLTGQHRAQWYRFSAGIGGGMLQLIHYAETGRLPNTKEDWREAFTSARKHLGMSNDLPQRSPAEQQALDERRERERKEREDRDQREREEQEKRDAKRQLNAQGVWNESVKLAGTPGEAYLMGRGIPPISQWPWDCHDTLRFHPALDFELDWGAGIRPVRRFPAVVGCVKDAFGEIIAVWQVYLDRDKPVKADLDPSPKMGRGPAAGGAVRIGGDADRIGTAEGMETAIALWVLEGYRKPVWATLSTSGMRSFEPPMNVTHVSIYPDGDRGVRQDEKFFEPPGISAARELYKRMKSIDIGANINEMAVLGDGLDLLMTRQKYERPAERKEKRAGNTGEHPG